MRPLPLLALPVLLVLTATALLGCAGSSPAQATVPVAIQDLKAVAGKWSGIYSRDTSSSSREDWVRLSINEDRTYELTSSRQVGVLHGRGRLTLRDGKLYGLGERGGTLAFSLFEQGGKPLLRVAAQDAAGMNYTADLTRGQ